MEWFSMLAAAVLFAAACNFDTVILAMGAGKAAAKGIHEYLSQK